MAVKKTMPIWDKRMFMLLDHVKAHKIKGIDSNPLFIKAVGISSLATIDQAKNLKQSFRHKHFLKASQLFDVSMDWFFGFTDNMKRNNVNASVEDLLHQALAKLKNAKK